MTLTQECLDTYKAYFACKIADLMDKYVAAERIGSSCSAVYLFQMELAMMLNEQLTCIDVETEVCLTEEQICSIIDKLKEILNNPCKCN